MGIEWLELTSYGRGKEFVTITNKNSKQVYISAKVVKEYIGEETKYARIGLDIDDKIMYIKPMTHNDPKAVRVSYGGKKDNSSRIIGSRLLLEKVVQVANQPKHTTLRYEIKWNKPLQALEVLLNKPLGDIEKEDNVIWQ